MTLLASADEAFAGLLRAEPDAVRNPYPIYRRLRRQSGCYWYQDDIAVLTSYSAVRSALTDSRRFNSTRGEDRFDVDAFSEADRDKTRQLLEFESLSLATANGEVHRRLRRLVQQGFTQGSVNALEGYVQTLVNDELDRISGPGIVDLMPMATRVPLFVVMRMLGAADEDVDFLKTHTDSFAAVKIFAPKAVSVERVRQAHESIGVLRRYVADLASHHRQLQANNLLSVLLTAQDEDRLTYDEVAASFVIITVAGHETTSNLVGNGLHDMLVQRDQWEKLVADPSLAASAVEEVSRANTPAQMVSRTTVADVVVDGTEVPEGSPVLVVFGAANRDPAEFEDPDRFDITRPVQPHVGFGMGAHICLGAALARLEGRIIFETICQRFPDLQLAADPQTFEWLPTPTFHGLRRLPVTLGADRGRTC